MKKCILCGKEHEGGCDKSEWDGILKAKFNIPEIVGHVENIESDALKEQERQHLHKKRGRPRRA